MLTPEVAGDAARPAEVPSLTIDFCGEVRVLVPPDTLTFGRRADLCIDENPYLHRVVGRLVSRQGLWWLQNLGTKIVIEVRDRASAARTQLIPGQQLALVFRDFIIGFGAGPTTYELEAMRAGESVDSDLLPEPTGTETIDFGVVPMSSEQHLLLVALCEHRLLLGTSEMPTNAMLASRLGWTVTKFNRKLDHLCVKLSREGVRGLHGGPAGSALDRRQALVDHALRTALVTPDDLGLLSRRAS